jgi:phenylpropionate dioxygenase-like ring-hydroxylating dioxygenase large terminal subunit
MTETAEGFPGAPVDAVGDRLARLARGLPVNRTFSENDWSILARFWHPVAFSDQVTDAPVSARLLDIDLVVYRAAQGVVVARDICLHRGARLSLGRIRNSQLECVYHGWRYGPDGACALIPSQPPEGRISPNIRLLTYPACERYGMVWACLSGTPGTGLPEWPEAQDPAYRLLHLPTQDWDTSAARQLENFLDISHFGFVHAATFGNTTDNEIPAVPVERTDSGLHYDFSYLAANPEGSTLGDAPMVQRHTSYDVTLPFACRLTIHYPEHGPDARHVLFDLAAPAAAKQMRVFFFLARNFDHHVPDRDLLAWEAAILAQDRPVVESQQPEQLPLDLGAELHVQADSMTIAYRRELASLGLSALHSA